MKPMIFQTFGLGQTDWADNFCGIFGQIISTILALCLVHEKMDLVVFATKNFGFQA
jgi:hypothetical protein